MGATAPSTPLGLTMLRFTLHQDDQGVPFLVDASGVRQEVAVDNSRSTSSLSGAAGTPMHPSNLFGGHREGGTASSVEFTLSDPLQLEQLNAIRGVIGTTSARLLTTTAIVAEQQTATEDMHDTLRSIRHEFQLMLSSHLGTPLRASTLFDRCAQAVLRTKDRAHVAFAGGHRVDLSQGMRAPKVDNPLRYRGADDHDAFMMFLERILGWMKANNCGGADLDAYRITLLQNYLDEDALRWFVHEVDNPRKNGGRDLEFADVVCLLHRRYVKSSTAQQRNARV
ncbi:hypothetical protein C8J57DRAFT_1507036 [Mycena rebaudengoi]|nr:hypothetical protein C8J57DRAFT_1507036 [Mycena rebaudengoi]